ncbi:MAG: hypothetical protein AB2448_01795 [Moorella sp. (in: firmicutes)]
MIKLSKPRQVIEEQGIKFLVRTPEQVEEDLKRIKEHIKKTVKAISSEEPNEEKIKENFNEEYWRKLLGAKIPICPVCGQAGGPIRRTVEGEILGCDHCLVIAGYYDTDALVGVKEAAEILGWDTRRVATYRSRGSFPEPVAELAMGPVWYRSQIEEYKKQKQQD